MKEITITSREAGQRLDKYLGKYLKEAQKSFLYKMLRKKNITLNGKKADGSEKLQSGDSVRIYFSEETLQKFTGVRESGQRKERADERVDEYAVSEGSLPYRPLDILYEDEHVCLINKPAGILSQKAKPSDISLVEYLTAYLLREGEITREELQSFHPAVCNRLDRNTSGIVAAGKTIAGLQELGRLFHDRTMRKYYRTIVKGNLSEPCLLEGYLKKDNAANQVKVYEEELPDSLKIKTEYTPIEHFGDATLLEVHLITGRSHQIRAHLASIGHPIAGDRKYGDPLWNDVLRKRYGLKYQLLHACRLELPELGGALKNISKKTFTAPLPEQFQRVRKGMAGAD